MKAVKKFRESKGWTQNQLAYHAGLATSVISQVENGKRDPSASTLRKLADALDVAIPDLFRGEEIPKAQTPLPFPPHDNGDGGGVSQEDISNLVRRITALATQASTFAVDWKREANKCKATGKGISPDRYIEIGFIATGVWATFYKALREFWRAAFEGEGGPERLAEWDDGEKRILLDYVARVQVMTEFYRSLEAFLDEPRENRADDRAALISEFRVEPDPAATAFTEDPRWPEATRKAEEHIEKQVSAA